MTFHQRRKLMMVVLAAALVVSATAASSASAIIKQLPNHRVVSYEPLRNSAAAAAATAAAPTPPDIASVNQEYNGGPVMPSNTNFMLLWSPQGLGAQSRQKSLNRYGASAVQTAVLAIDRWPSHPWIARVSCPLLARA